MASEPEPARPRPDTRSDGVLPKQGSGLDANVGPFGFLFRLVLSHSCNQSSHFLD